MKIEINLPKWMGTIWLTGKYAHSSIKWILNPIRCSHCNSIMPTKNVEVRVGGTYGRWGGSNTSRDRNICQHCIATIIRNGNASHGIFGSDLDDFDTANHCDRCGSDKPSQKFYSDELKTVDVRILGNLWNHAKICKDCCADIFDYGVATTGCMTSWNGKLVDISYSSGLFIVNGKTKLFALIKGY